MKILYVATEMACTLVKRRIRPVAQANFDSIRRSHHLVGDRVAGPSDFLHVHGFVWSIHPKANIGLPVHLTTPQITVQEHFQFVLLT